MSRLIVPRGNGYDPPLPVYLIDSSSPRWELLTPDEQQAAAADVTRRPVMHVVMAARTLCECLGDARRAKTPEEWVALRDRLGRVKSLLFSDMFRGEDGPEFRERWERRLRARMILLHVERAVAEAAAVQVVGHLFAWTAAGETPPPRFGVYTPHRPPEVRFFRFEDSGERSRSQECWDREHQLLRDGKDLAVGECFHDELRSFASEPTPDAFLAARGPALPRDTPEAKSPALTTLESALKHAQHRVHSASGLVERLRRRVTRRDELTQAELGEDVCRHFKWLMAVWEQGHIATSVIDHLSESRDALFEFPPVVATSTHEAALELTRRLVVAFRWRIVLDEPYTFNVLFDGPWEGCEVGRGIQSFWEGEPELCEAFSEINTQRLLGQLKLETQRAVKTWTGTTPPGSDEPPPSAGGGGGERNRGRPCKSDPALDKNISDAISGGLTVARLAKEHQMTEADVQKAVKRHKERERQERRKSSRK